MEGTNQRSAIVERGCIALLLLWVAWLPLPFGSIVARARPLLIVPPIAFCALAALVRALATRDRQNHAQPTLPWLIWSGGAVLIAAIGLLQLVPLPRPLLHALSPESSEIWTSAAEIARMAGLDPSTRHPVSVDPRATGRELLRLGSLLAAFTAAALLIRTHERRVALATVLCGTAIFEALFGVREAALQRYEIWGWVNRLVFDRVTGTFVNPNHYAHYIAMVLPMALFLVAAAWRVAASHRAPIAVRMVQMFERSAISTGFALMATIACVVAILLSQSRGALLASVGGILTVAALAPGRRVWRIVLGAAAAGVILFVLVLFLDPSRTITRFLPSRGERETLVGRTIGISTGIDLWQRFPILGSGLGTFDRVVAMEQPRVGSIYHHAHNDYVEMAATSGSIGALVAVVSLLGGYLALLRMTFGRDAERLSWRRRAFQAAALGSLTIAMVHALVDFNFFIPSNPATLAVIIGAAVASTDHDKRAKR